MTTALLASPPPLREQSGGGGSVSLAGHATSKNLPAVPSADTTGIFGVSGMTRMHWTAAMLDELRKLRTEGLSRAQCAARIGGVTKYQVARAVTYHKLSLPNGDVRPKRDPISWSTEQIDEIDRLLDQKPRPTYAQIARHFGCSKNAVAGVIRRNELSKRGGTPAAVSIAFPATGCIWPVGNPGDPGFHFCGAPSIRGPEGQIWCAVHRTTVYIRLPALPRALRHPKNMT